VFEWQKRPLEGKGAPPEALDGFELMLTTKFGPPAFPVPYSDMLEGVLRDNMIVDGELAERLERRAMTRDVAVLKGRDFKSFFLLSVPKIVVGGLKEEDWHVDPAEGVRIFEFDRTSNDVTYTMLHFVMRVRRNSPPVHLRAPVAVPAAAQLAYRDVVRQIFSDPPIQVRDDTIDKEDLQKHLDKIISRQGKYRKEA
jgi:hypothetical protein